MHNLHKCHSNIEDAGHTGQFTSNRFVKLEKFYRVNDSTNLKFKKDNKVHKMSLKQIKN